MNGPSLPARRAPVRGVAALMLAAVGLAMLAGEPAQAQYYYPPPGYYPPAQPPVYYPPPSPSQRDLNRAYDPTIDGPLGYATQRGRPPVPYSAMCYAGNYTCQLPQAGPVGSGCACPGLGAPSYGPIR